MSEIRVFDYGGNNRVSLPVHIGDEIEYKRDGMRGSSRCVVVSVGEHRLTLRGSGRAFSVPLRSYSFLHLYRDGRRLP